MKIIGISSVHVAGTEPDILLRWVIYPKFATHVMRNTCNGRLGS